MLKANKVNILQAFFSLRARHLQASARETVLQQLRQFPPHLIDDVDARQTADQAPKQFNKSDETHKIYSLV